MKRVSCVVKATVVRPNTEASKTPVAEKLAQTSLEVRAKAFLETLRKNHVAIAEMLPLQIQVNKVLHELYPTIPHKVINTALYYHTSCIGYLEQIHRGFGRFTVDKVFVENISDEDREVVMKAISLYAPMVRVVKSSMNVRRFG